MRTTVATLVGAVLLAGGLAACSSEAPPSSPAVKPVAETEVAAPAASGDQPKGITYDVARIPVGAKLSTGSSVENGQTTVELKVSGLLPDTKYGSHVHTKPCGAKPADSGPHYQNEKDPVSPSVDPKFANPDNEIWLDLTTDAFGNALATATVNWVFHDRRPRAVVLHETHTHTAPGQAGSAGARLACVTVGLTTRTTGGPGRPS